MNVKEAAAKWGISDRRVRILCANGHIIVSEETGGISAAYKGQFHLRLTAEELERILTKED